MQNLIEFCITIPQVFIWRSWPWQVLVVNELGIGLSFNKRSGWDRAWAWLHGCSVTSCHWSFFWSVSSCLFCISTRPFARVRYVLDKANHSGITVWIKSLIISRFQLFIWANSLFWLDCVLEVSYKSFSLRGHFNKHSLVINHTPSSMRLTASLNTGVRVKCDKCFLSRSFKSKFVLGLKHLDHIWKSMLANFLGFENIRSKGRVFIYCPITVDICFQAVNGLIS
jgi:hypothetical protein